MECFVEFCGFFEVDDVDVAVGGGDDEELVLDVHGVDPFLVFNVGDRGGAAEIPVLDCFVPGAGYQHGVAGGLDEAAHADGLLMSSDLLGYGGVGS